MKKTVSVLLALLFCLSSFALTAGARTEENDLKIAVASDLHYDHASEELEKTNGDEIYWYANRRAAMEEESGFIIDEFLRQCEEDDSIGYVLISGDLADDGRTRPEDHETVAAKLEAFEKRSGKEVFVINGNHDAAADSATTYDDFRSVYANLGYDHALSTTDHDCSYTADLGEKYRLIALDSNNPDESTEDGMNLKKLSWVKKQAKKAEEDGRYPIVMMHHNLLDHLPVQRLLSHDFIVRFHYSTATMFAEWGIKTVLSGHEHCSDATSYTTPSGKVITDFATTSLTMYPLSYRVFTFTDETISYESRTVENIDTAALAKAQPLLTDTQFSSMSGRMNDYALGFLKTGVEYRLALSLTPGKMKISEDDFYYELVMNLIDGLTGLLEMPLYGENSVESTAKEYGISIPASGYQNLWDLATSLVAQHYAGQEAFALDSTEVKILLRGVSLILKDDLSGFNDEIILSWITDLLYKNGMDGLTTSLTKLCSSVFGGIRPDEYAAAAILAPFLYEFAFDSDGVNDNTGSIEGYGRNQPLRAIGDGIAAKFTKLFTYISLMFGYFIRIFTFGK